MENNQEEIWKETDVVGYYISNLGRLKGRSGKIVKTTTNKQGYLVYASYPDGRNGKCKTLKIHRLVAEAFIPNPENKHPILRGVEKPNAKLTVEDVLYIRKHYKPYDSLFGTRGLARKFGVDHKQIVQIIKEKAYNNV